MKRRRLLKRLNTATLELSAPGVWLLDETFADELRRGMVEAWEQRDGDPATLAARIGLQQQAQDPQSELLQIVDGVGVVNVSGMLFPKPNMWTWYGMATATSDIRDAALEALGRADVKGVLLLVDSPGGRAQGVFEAAREIRAAAETAGKPIWSYVDGCAASGGYALATAGTRILAGHMAQVGSIGALMVHTQYRPTDAAHTVIRYGENKALGNPYESFDAKAAAEWQTIVDTIGSTFEQLVAEFRGVTLAQVQQRFGRGSVFFGSDATSRGLIDGGTVESIDAALAQFRTSLGLSNGSTTAHVNHESGKVAADNAAPFGKGSVMNPRLKAALFARGLIAAIDVADDICKAALTAFFAGRGAAQPDKDEACITAVMEPHLIAQVAEPLKQQAAAQPAKNVQAAHEQEMNEARLQARADETKRTKELRQRGQLIGVDPAQVEAAIQAGTSVADAVVAWTKPTDDSKPVIITGGEASGAKAFEKDATDAMLMRVGVKVDGASENAKRWGKGGAPMSFFAKQSLIIQGVRLGDMVDPEQVAQQALRANAAAVHEVSIDDAGALNRPASFPNLLSGLANKLLDEGIARANATYPEWTGVVAAGLPDLKPVPVVSKSTVYAMDEVIDDEKVNELSLAEEVLSSIQVRRFKNKFGWTPVMVANDDLGAFAEGMLGFGAAAENTVNLLCLSLITGNPTLLDGYALFDDSNHGNDVASNGAAISASEWSVIENKLAAQRPVGGKGYLREQLGVALVPPQLRVAAMQLLAAFGQVPELKNPVTDATLNVYRGTAKVVVEPELQANSTKKWYGLCDPTRAPTVVRVYQRGWGEGPRRTAWTDPETGTAWVAFETRVGAAIKNYRTIVRDKGET